MKPNEVFRFLSPIQNLVSKKSLMKSLKRKIQFLFGIIFSLFILVTSLVFYNSLQFKKIYNDQVGRANVTQDFEIQKNLQSTNHKIDLYNLTAIIILLFIFIFAILTYIYFIKYILKPIESSADNLKVKSDELVLLSQNLTKVGETLLKSSSSQSEIAKSGVLAIKEIKKLVDVTNQLILQAQDFLVGITIEISNGNKTLEEFKHSMENIKSSTQNLDSILHIIGTISSNTEEINNIAFSSKLLSFNAAIEAASTGVHGKGFAIIADEIRRFAKSSATSVEKINNLLTNGQSEVHKIMELGQCAVSKGDVISLNVAHNFKTISDNLVLIDKQTKEIFSFAKIQQNKIENAQVVLNDMDVLATSTNHISSTIHQFSERLKNLNLEIVEVKNHMDQIVSG